MVKWDAQTVNSKHPLAVLAGVHRVKEGLNFKGQDSNSFSVKYLGFHYIPCIHSFASKFKKCLAWKESRCHVKSKVWRNYDKIVTFIFLEITEYSYVSCLLWNMSDNFLPRRIFWNEFSITKKVCGPKKFFVQFFTTPTNSLITRKGQNLYEFAFKA